MATDVAETTVLGRSAMRRRTRAAHFAGLFGRLGRRPERRLDDARTTTVSTGEPAPGVLEIRLTGGSRRNVLGRSTMDRIDQLVSRPPNGTRAILLTAEPPDFCAGYDLVEAHRTGAERLIADEDNFQALRCAGLPVVVALHGRVIGGGLELALAADVRVAAPDTVLAVPASTLGLVYSGAGLRLFVSALGESVARAMVLGGRVVSAAEGAALGALSEVVPGDDLYVRAVDVAASIASWPALATSNNRRAIDVVTGRAQDDVGALRRASFAEDGALTESIEAFVAGRELPDVLAPRRRSPWPWRAAVGALRSWGRRRPPATGPQI